MPAGTCRLSYFEWSWRPRRGGGGSRSGPVRGGRLPHDQPSESQPRAKPRMTWPPLGAALVGGCQRWWSRDEKSAPASDPELRGAADAEAPEARGEDLPSGGWAKGPGRWRYTGACHRSPAEGPGNGARSAAGRGEDLGAPTPGEEIGPLSGRPPAEDLETAPEDDLGVTAAGRRR